MLLRANIFSDRKDRSVENISTEALFFLPFFFLKTYLSHVPPRTVLSVVSSLIGFVPFGITQINKYINWHLQINKLKLNK